MVSQGGYQFLGDGPPVRDTVDAKGDLLAGTADSAITRLPVGANGTTLRADSSQATGMRWATSTDQLGSPFTAGGEAVCDRRWVTSGSNGTVSGFLNLTYFVAQVSETINTLVLYCSGTAAATATLIRYGVYSVAANGDLTLVASTANDTALMAAANTRYPKPTSAPWAKVAGQRYAAGMLVVATTAPTTVAVSSLSHPLYDTLFAQEPRLFGAIGSQTDLPTSATAASVAASRRAPYVEMLP